MSITWVNHAVAAGPKNRAEFSVYLALAIRAADDGSCFPSQAKIAEDARLSVRAVKRAMQSVLRSGWIERLTVGNSVRRSSTYRLRRIPVPLKADATGVKTADATGVKTMPDAAANQTGAKTAPSLVSKRHFNWCQNGIPPTPPIGKNRQLTVMGTGSGSTAPSRSALPPQATADPAEATDHGADLAASHQAPARRAAKRQAPSKARRSGQVSIPLDSGRRRSVGHRLHQPGVSKGGGTTAREPRDPRFTDLANILRNEYWGSATKGGVGDLVLSAADKAGLSDVLYRNLDLSLEVLTRCLQYRTLSIEAGELNGAEPPARWIRELPRFALGPLNRFGDPLQRRKTPHEGVRR